MLDLRDAILATPKDIEELVEAGTDSRTCPYFGARNAVPMAEVGYACKTNVLVSNIGQHAVGHTTV